MTTTINTVLTGANFRGAEAKDIVRRLAIGARLDLEAEPDNHYDRFAVMVIYAGEHIGYVARGDNLLIFGALRAGVTPVAEVVGFETPLKPLLIVEL